MEAPDPMWTNREHVTGSGTRIVGQQTAEADAEIAYTYLQNSGRGPGLVPVGTSSDARRLFSAVVDELLRRHDLRCVELQEIAGADDR